MPAIIPSIQLLPWEEANCDSCGESRGPHYASGGEIRCGKCELQYVKRKSTAFSTLIVLIILSAIVTSIQLLIKGL